MFLKIKEIQQYFEKNQQIDDLIKIKVAVMISKVDFYQLLKCQF
jgi:hypothetical protein